MPGRNKVTTAILTGTGIAGVITGASTVYNSNETIKSNERMHKETTESKERIEMAKIESNERIEMEKLEVEKYKTNLPSKHDHLDPTNSNDSVRTESIKNSTTENDNDPLISKDSTTFNSSELDNVSQNNEVNSELNSVSQYKEDDTLMETTDASFEENNVSVDPNTNSSGDCVINSMLETDLLNTNFDNILQSAGFSFACFAFIGLFVGISLSFNLIIQNYGEKKINNLPKWVQTLFQYYSKYLLAQNSFLLVFLIGSQTISLLLGLYLFFINV